MLPHCRARTHCHCCTANHHRPCKAQGLSFLSVCVQQAGVVNPFPKIQQAWDPATASQSSSQPASQPGPISSRTNCHLRPRSALCAHRPLAARRPPPYAGWWIDGCWSWQPVIDVYGASPRGARPLTGYPGPSVAVHLQANLAGWIHTHAHTWFGWTGKYPHLAP